jgi:hypothetical protein
MRRRSQKKTEGTVGIIMCYVHWGTVGAAVLATTTLTFAAPNGETFNSETRSCSEIADGPRQLRVRMPEVGMDADVLALVRAEVDAIWRQYAIDIVWEERWTPGKPAPDLWVQYVDIILPSKSVRGSSAVAWIPFSNGQPLPYVRVSKPVAAALLKTRSWFDGRPITSATEDVRRQALGRIIGRAIAHEVGHFLLSSPVHASRGLMRAALDPQHMVNPGTGHFKLEGDDVRALRAARIASCEMALRH